MPELPDITLYREALEQRILGRRLERAPPQYTFPVTHCRAGARVSRGRERRYDRAYRQTYRDRLRQRRMADLSSDDRWAVPLRDKPPKTLPRQTAIALDFTNGSLTLTEAGTKKRASLYVVRGRAELARHNPGGLEIDVATAATFQAVLQERNHTLKRALTDPRLLSGIGNAYSDEILHRARLSPVALTSRLSATDFERLLSATREVLAEWSRRLRERGGRKIPGARNCVSRGNGRAWSLRQALSGVRHQSAADSLCGERDELLPAMPDGWQAAGRSIAVAPSEERLAEVDR